jgi:RNA polymerase sigma-70 factor (ECF subfamily)
MPSSSDSESFAAALEHHQGALIALALDRTGRWDVAEEIAQQTITTAWEHRSDLRDRTSLDGWLWRIALNCCVQWQRREARLHDLPEAATRDHAAAEIAADVIRRETIREVRAALAELPLRSRVALLMRVAGCSYDEIAESLQLTPATVRGRIARARDRLRRDLARRLHLHLEREKARP